MEIFREISVGGQKKDILVRRLIDAGVLFNDYATALFEHPEFTPPLQREPARLVKATAAELGAAEPCSLATILEKAAARGLKACPLYLGAFLRLDWKEQPECPYLTVASSPPAHVGAPTGFYLRNTGGALWLRGYRAEGDVEWPKENAFVFLRGELAPR